MGNVFAYMRISTQEERAKQRFVRQEKSLEAYAAKNGIEFLLTFKDDASGKNFERPEWRRMMRLIQPGDTIVMKDISRFTRERENGYDMYMSLMDRGISLVFLDNPTLDTSYMQKLLGVASEESWLTKESMRFIARILLKAELDRCEQERLLISQRTREGLAARKKEAEEKGLEWRAGRRPGTLDKMTPALRKDLLFLKHGGKITGAEIMRRHDISRNTLKKYLKIVSDDE